MTPTNVVTVRDKVLLSTKNLKTWRPSKKMKKKFDRPFPVVEVVGTQTYCLRLPKSLRLNEKEPRTERHSE
jgi:hypothetical protein